MPARTDIQKVLIIGSGPIVIGQAGEFDYSGSQACKALRGLGYTVVLVNSNPATIMTDPSYADATYIEPLNTETLARIIDKERPDAILPNLGGQTGLNLTSALSEAGILSRYNVEILGVQLDAIKRGEDRIEFKQTMEQLGIGMPRSAAADTLEEAEAIATEFGFPLVIRPAYTMGGTGGGHVYNIDEFREIAYRGLQASRVHQILIEESVIGWQELEVEVVRDAKNQMVAVCFIENVDPMGVHTGDSFCVAPMLTISAEVQQQLQEYAFRIVESIGVIGGTNVQFGRDPQSGRIVIIEINPRTSRSSALASKATGFPIALISALLACGLTLDEIPYWRDGTLERYTPSGDYVVVKFARWAFEKFKNVEDKLGTQMRAVGEVMSIGRTYKEAFHKAVRSLENGRSGLGFAADFHQRSLSELYELLAEPSSERQFILYEAFRKGATVDDLHERTHITRWFLQQMQELVQLEKQILQQAAAGSLNDDLLVQAKQDGFSDRYLAEILGLDESRVRARRRAAGAAAQWDAIPVSGVENAAYYYSTYHTLANAESRQGETEKPTVIVLGGGPYRIGQGIEFDYCCVHAAFTLREMGYRTVMINCNPETVSTDFDTSDTLYFEPLTVEDVLAIYEHEQPEGILIQFGGQTPLNIARELEQAGAKILGTSPDTIDVAEDRERFEGIMRDLNIPMAASGFASSLEEAVGIADEVGYPVVVRPSYVLGGRGMEIVFDEDGLRTYVTKAAVVTPHRPVLIDRFLENAVEAEADALADGRSAFVPAVMQHIEFAGIHSGDSACVIPAAGIPEKHQETIRKYTRDIAVRFGVVGLLNIQYAIADDQVYILEANPRASRTVPLVSKVCGFSMADSATRLAMGQSLEDLQLKERQVPYFGVKESVFPFNMFPEVDPLLGPEMRSTGEVLATAETFPLAFFKAQEAAGQPLPTQGSVLITVAKRDKERMLPAAEAFVAQGFRLLATAGTAQFLQEQGLACEVVHKIHEGRPNIVDVIRNNEVQLLVNTPHGSRSEHDDSEIRKAAIRSNIPYITTTQAALAAAQGIAMYRQVGPSVASVQERHAAIGG
ncbi:carbamoyl-phosphate synthase large subunit [Spirochaeta africana]|uniref:Carbamoyl-phosphate synthase, large subunit n=1 Tax=Spirochaeta africana (strain ATCC 700263 / DSM 8902 / Z-7692) TaxID=889378 RepID=H9UK62_SPIAZ|nr:carbamoyl-phosphate synthase large subunit [Spirochaeta africana]AFG37905.1 carbamoyl-phosphate synthase, large subunit [Spirochaeta africana DSM 8902]